MTCAGRCSCCGAWWRLTAASSHSTPSSSARSERARPASAGWHTGVPGQLPSGAFMQPRGGWEWVSPSRDPPLQQDPLPAGLQLGFGVPVPPREVTAGSQLTLCGHCRLRPANSEQREHVWNLLRGLLETYSRLREEDQSFAVEVLFPGVSLAVGASQGCEAAWSPGTWGKALGQGLWGSSLEQWKLRTAPGAAWLSLGGLSSLPPHLHPRPWSG